MQKFVRLFVLVAFALTSTLSGIALAEHHTIKIGVAGPHSGDVQRV